MDSDGCCLCRSGGEASDEVLKPWTEDKLTGVKVSFCLSTHLKGFVVSDRNVNMFPFLFAPWFFSTKIRSLHCLSSMLTIAVGMLAHGMNASEAVSSLLSCCWGRVLFSALLALPSLHLAVGQVKIPSKCFLLSPSYSSSKPLLSHSFS